MFRIVGRLGNRKVPVIRREGSYVAARSVGATSIICGPYVEFLVIRDIYSVVYGWTK